MKKMVFGLSLVMFLLLAGCAQEAPQEQPPEEPAAPAVEPAAPAEEPEEPMPGSDRDEYGCIPSAGYEWCEPLQKCIRPWEEECFVHLNEDQARTIVLNSQCMAVGPIVGEGTYNNNTYTWWFDLHAQRPGCSPACVVYEANETADVNWRCTGLITE